MMSAQTDSNPNIITAEEGYELTKRYVQSFWTKFYSLKDSYEIDDVVSMLFIKFTEKKFFEKYDSTITSKKYHVMNAVKRSMIDLLRKQKSVSSLDKEDEEGLTMMDRMESPENIEEGVIGRDNHSVLVDLLSDETNSKVQGLSPILGECKMTHRAIALHLEAGFSIKEIASFYINPKNMKPVTDGRIHQLVQEIREEFERVVPYINRA